MQPSPAFGDPAQPIGDPVTLLLERLESVLLVMLRGHDPLALDPQILDA
jgi:hypothetical protein